MRSVPTTPGETVGGKYEVTRVIGEGAQGVVVEALHLRLGQRVALKFLHPSSMGDKAVVTRFEREARNAAALRSAYAPRVFDVDHVDGLSFIVEELLEGHSLADEIREQGALPIERAVDIVRQACAAIAEAHERGIVHRDIKASNVFLAREGGAIVAKVLDFGVSKGLERSLDVTEAGAVLGSPRWMSPEQISDPATTDARTDIWSLGVLLFHALTGAHAFGQQSMQEVLIAIAFKEPNAPRALRAEIPEELEAEILRTLEKDPARRHASVKELAAALAPFGAARVSAELATCAYLALGNAPAPPPPASRPPAVRTNVAPVLTRFFGRASDLERLERLIGEGRRVLTLLGPAGAGKTRLALQLATQRAAAHAGGVWFCDLTDARDLDGVLISIGHAVEASLAAASTEQAAMDQLARMIASRGSTLLVLDNCEQVIDAAARVVERISELAPDAVQVATSRARLRVSGEQVHLVTSLDIDTTNPFDNDAVRLFVDRARSVDATFSPTAEDGAALLDIVRRLDGLPLAIELAAARMGMLGVQDIRARLEERFKLLAGGPRFASERQRTMRGAIDWSWELLGETERTALAQCAVFRGGFAIEAAEKIVDAGGSSPMLDTLQSLGDKSLLFASDLRDLGERRYRLYESVRAYALDRLRESGGEENALDRHANYFAEAGARWAKAAARGDATEPRNRIAVELENLLGAHRHALARASLRTSGMATTAFTLLRPIAELLKRRGPLDLLLSLLDATLVDTISSQTDPSLVGEALRDRAMARHFAPDAGAAKIADLTRALEIARQSKDVALELSCLNVLVSVELLHGRPDAARQHVRVAVERARAHGDKRALAKAYSDLGACDLAVGRLEEARASLQEAIALSRTAGDRLETALYLARLSETVLQLGRFEEAQACADEGFELASPFHQNRVLALLSGVRAIIAYEQEKLEVARARYGEALTFAEQAGAELLYPFYRASRGAVLADMDDIDGATADVAAATAVLPRFADDAVLGVTVRITQGHLDLALSRAAERAGDTDAALTHRLNAGRCLDALDESKSDFEDLRLMRRRLERAIAVSSGGLTPSTDDDRAGALVVEQSGEWFRVPSGERVDLSQRPNLKRLLVSLTLHRIGASGEPLSLAAVFRSGWPGERADDDSAANRARVAMARLRKLGLRDVLLTKGGYYLDPSVRVVIARRDDV